MNRDNEGWGNSLLAKLPNRVDTLARLLRRATERVHLSGTINRDSNLNTIFLEQVDMVLGNQNPVRLDSIRSELLVSKLPNLLQMLDRSQERLPSKDRESRVVGFENLLNPRPISRDVDIARIPHWVLVAVGAGKITRDSDREVFDGHGPINTGSSL